MSAAAPRPPLRFVFGAHLHQPVGNFDHVFADHARDVYHPLVRQLERRRFGPALLHVSGPLLEWLEQHDTALLDRVGRLAADGQLELLLAGMYEPILAAIPRGYRIEQIAWHREALRARFGVAGDGLWLTERVWTPDLAADLASAGVRYVLVDDRHFLVSGYDAADLHVPFRTEHDGKALTLLAIDEHLRYLIPFKPAEQISAYLRELHQAGRPLAVFADDGEKFGGWPGTSDWVYARGWFDAFCDAVDTLRDEGVLQLSSGRDAVATVSARGPAYLPTSSYAEMEAWALPPAAAVRLTALENELGPARLEGADGSLLRGGHWHHFLAKYGEANRMHKKMLALSAVSHARKDPPGARRSIGRAQCNDALWHGVFGGLYLPHLRAAVWQNLADAERVLREGESLAAETLDIDFDGAEEIWVHSHAFSAIVAPSRGGALIEYTRFNTGVNYADALTRRLEAYHIAAVHDAHASPADGGAVSIHELARFQGADRPVVDLDERAIGVARVLQAGLTLDEYRAAAYHPVTSWACERCAVRTEHRDGTIAVRCDAIGFRVEWRFQEDGGAEVQYEWDGGALQAGDWFAPELSLSRALPVDAPGAARVWEYDIETVTASERAVERIRQGRSVTPMIDARAGMLTVRLR